MVIDKKKYSTSLKGLEENLKSIQIFQNFDCSFRVDFVILNFIIYRNISVILCKVKLVTAVEGDLKVPFSIATTPRCRGGRYSFPWIAPLYP